MPVSYTHLDVYKRQAHPRAKVHSYDKLPRPGRKVGHVTVTGDDLASVLAEARAAAAKFD